MHTYKVVGSAAIICVFLSTAPTLAQQFGEPVQHFAQIALGGGAVTLFSLHNPGAVALTIDIQLYRSDGTSLQTQAVEVPSHGTSTVSFGDAAQPLTAGWARLLAAGPFGATEFFQIQLGGVDLPRVGVLPSPPTGAFKAFCCAKGQTRTGIAVANPDPAQTAHVVARRLSPQGQTVETCNFEVGPTHHRASYFDEAPYFPGLDNFEGSLEIESDVPLIAVTLRSDQNLLSTVAVLTPQSNALALGSVETGHLKDGAVTTDKIADDAVTKAKLATGQVVTSLNSLTDDVALAHVCGF